jgi:hypothetical protein
MLGTQNLQDDNCSVLRAETGVEAAYNMIILQTKKTKLLAWVRERTIPTERPPVVGEVSANICG